LASAFIKSIFSGDEDSSTTMQLPGSPNDAELPLSLLDEPVLTEHAAVLARSSANAIPTTRFVRIAAILAVPPV
jgi:hypothetical protein